MLDYSLITAYILSIFLFLGTPGPVTVLVVNASIKDGFLAGFKTVAGTNTASLILITLSFVIIQGVFSVSEQALNWLTLLCSLYLLYFSIGILKDKVDIKQTIEENSEKVTKNHFRDGFTVGISNPKDILFFIAFFPMFLKISDNVNVSMLLLVLIWIALDYIILSCYSFVFSKISNNRVANIINKLSGSILLLVAIYAIVKMIRTLFF